MSGANIIKNPQVFNIGAAQTQSQDNWTYVPVTDVEDLGRTRCLYKFAVIQAKEPHASWSNFRKDCKVGGKSLTFDYSPPLHPWLKWTAAADYNAGQGISEYEFAGIYRAYALWVKLPDFHDFELAILGSIPNTAGAASTTKVAAAAAPALSLLSDDPIPSFKEANQTMKFMYRVRNTGNDTITQIGLSSMKVQIANCASFDLAAGEQRNCDGTYKTTEDDLVHCVDILVVAVGTSKGEKGGGLGRGLINAQPQPD
jgi:hypothetical protein